MEQVNKVKKPYHGVQCKLITYGEGEVMFAKSWADHGLSGPGSSYGYGYGYFSGNLSPKGVEYWNAYYNCVRSGHNPKDCPRGGWTDGHNAIAYDYWGLTPPTDPRQMKYILCDFFLYQTGRWVQHDVENTTWDISSYCC